ncbi:DUF4328 domain-containing protein [Kribbella sp. NPDC023855]|uniref:DUF4328 domain-containing protein n=1 Tax=Kribbella sp. NPDC023855 TaxID=3154698 RepID=UPI0033C6A89F
MSQPYPGPPGYFPVPPLVLPPVRRYRPLRRVTTAFLVLAVLTLILTAVQAVLMWRSYDEVKRFVYGLLSDDELDRAVASIAGSGPLLNLMWMTFAGAGAVFLIWLWKARENTELLTPSVGVTYQGGQRLGSGRHRLDTGWVIGSWVCPIVQFWYPLQVVEDVVQASEPTDEPKRVKTLLYAWWACWTAFWVIIVGGGSLAFFSIAVWIVRVLDRAEAATESGDYLDLYDLQSFMVGLALTVNIAFTIATVLLAAAGAAVVMLMYRTNAWQDARMSRPTDQPPPGPPQYAPRPEFPSYAQRSPWQR